MPAPAPEPLQAEASPSIASMRRMDGMASIRSACIVSGALIALFALGACESAPDAATGPSPGAAGTGEGAGMFEWLDVINPFKGDSRAAVESYRVTATDRPDGWHQATLDLDLSRGEGPKSLLCAITRSTRTNPGTGAVERLDLISLIVRDDPRELMLFDDAPAFLVVARERHALDPLPQAPDAVKRAGDELQCRRSFRVPDGLFDRLVEGAPVQLVVVLGGQEITRTLPGAACETIEGS